MNRKFTLIEVIILIVVIGILVAIVLVNVGEVKKDTIRAALNSNKDALQTAVDRYVLDNGEYPIKEGEVITLDEPKYIDFNKLYPKYIKNQAKLEQIEKQYYWIDVFGKVWSSTEESANDIIRGENSIEVTLSKRAKGYSIYEVTGHGSEATVSKKRYTKIHSKSLSGDNYKIQIPDIKDGVSYLFSTIDKYGLESAPVGLNYPGMGSLPPILYGEGTYKFEITSFDTMYWKDFQSIHETPGESKINYSFAVQNEEGEYGEFIEDFFSLEPSKGIKVKVELIADGENKPTIYSMRVFYHYEYEEVNNHIFPKVELEEPEVEDNSDYRERFGGWSSPKEEPKDLRGESSTNINAVVCGKGGSYTTVGYNGNILKGETEPKVVYNFKIPKGYSVNNISIPKLQKRTGYSLDYTSFEYSHEGEDYKEIDFVSDIPDNSCVKVIYHLKPVKNKDNDNNEVNQSKNPILTFGPTVKLTDREAKIIKDPPSSWSVSEKNGSESDKVIIPEVPILPEKGDKELEDQNWETVNTLKYFAHSGDGQIVRWISFTPDDVQPENTRIVYRFTTSNGYYWSRQYDKFSQLPQSKSLAVIAYLQVHKDFKDNPMQEHPRINGISIRHERGVINLDSIRPTLAIYAVKDNNGDRNVFSDKSNIEWTFEAFDPRGREIVEVEWDGDKRSNYEPGKYEIKLRVKNETNLWSDWVTYYLDVKQEKPVAEISIENLSGNNYIQSGDKLRWSYDKSYDPDGDGISKVEWAGEKRDFYDEAGVYVVKLRVQDNEGNWSDWAEKEIKIGEKAYKIYRIEAEDKSRNQFRTIGAERKYIQNSSSSGGEHVELRYIGEYVIFTFTGTGFDLKTLNINAAEIILNDKEVHDLKENDIFSMRNLDNKEHTVLFKPKTTGFNAIDYLDVFSSDDKPEIYNVKSNIISDGKDSQNFSTTFSPKLNQSLRIHYSLYKDSFVSVLVKDENGKEIRKIINNKNQQGGTINTHNVIWDGKDNNGNVVSGGDYTVEIIAVGVNNEGVDKYKLSINLDNEEPIYRIEAEDRSRNQFRTIGTERKYIQNSSSSGGEHVELRYIGEYVIFTFTGTGFDLKTLNINAAEAVLDNNKTYALNAHDLLSVRNLEDKQHTLTFKPTKTGYNSIDYIDVYSPVDKPSIYNVKSNIISNGKENPNIATHFSPRLQQSLKIYYTLHKNAKVSITIKNKNGLKVKDIISNVTQEGGTVDTHYVIWDGTNNNNEVLESGYYNIVITATGVNGSVTKYNYNVHLDNKKPSYRIEAEDTLDNNYYIIGSTSNRIKSNSSFSGGKSIYLNYVSEYITFEFKGTGFDLKTLAIREAEIILDDNKVYKLNSHDLLSVRDLEDKIHIVKVKPTRTGENHIDYLDVYQ